MDNRNFYCTLSGKAAIYHAIKNITKNNDNNFTIYIPNICCASIYSAVIKTKVEVRFYNKNENNSNYINYTDSINPSKKNILLLVSNYGEDISFSPETDLIAADYVIEDQTNYKYINYNSNADYVVFSTNIFKRHSLGGGGVIFSNEKIKCVGNKNLIMFTINLIMAKILNSYLIYFFIIKIFPRENRAKEKINDFDLGVVKCGNNIKNYLIKNVDADPNIPVSKSFKYGVYHIYKYSNKIKVTTKSKFFLTILRGNNIDYSLNDYIYFDGSIFTYKNLNDPQCSIAMIPLDSRYIIDSLN